MMIIVVEKEGKIKNNKIQTMVFLFLVNEAKIRWKDVRYLESGIICVRVAVNVPASAESKIAVAQSEASARVGVGLSIILRD